MTQLVPKMTCKIGLTTLTRIAVLTNVLYDVLVLVIAANIFLGSQPQLLRELGAFLL